MSNYRIVFLLCRALSTFFFWNVLFGTLTMGGAFLGFGTGGYGGFGFIVSLVFGALFRFFSVTIASSIVGQSAFEGEALSSRFENDPQFKALARSFTGLLLLAFGASQLLSSIISYGTLYFSGRSGLDVTFIGILAMWLAAPVLQIVLGLFFAFGGALKRISQTVSGVELASPDGSESKKDSFPLN